MPFVQGPLKMYEHVCIEKNENPISRSVYFWGPAAKQQNGVCFSSENHFSTCVKSYIALDPNENVMDLFVWGFVILSLAPNECGMGKDANRLGSFSDPSIFRLLSISMLHQ